jgi:hypothetical protein
VKTLVIVPCGQSKIWKKNPNVGPTKAEYAYTGPPFKVNKEYAMNFADKWVILSAKYGFIEPGFLIPEDYNITFNDHKTNPISLTELREQARSTLAGYDCVLALGGSTYANLVSNVFEGICEKVLTPTAGLQIGKAMGKVKSAVRQNKPFVC